MVFKLELSRTAQKALNKLPANAVKRIWVHLEEIKKDPYRPRPLADIVPVEGSAITYRHESAGSELNMKFTKTIIV